MKIISTTLIIIMTVFSPLENINAKSVIYSDSTIIIQTRPYNIDFLKTMSTKSMQTLLGRKLSFKEKAGLFFLKNSKKNKVYAGNDEEVKSKKGTWSLILGISSFLLLGPLGAIPAIILGAQALKENPNDSNARAGKILGIVYLALSVVAILLLIAVYSGAWI